MHFIVEQIETEGKKVACPLFEIINIPKRQTPSNRGAQSLGVT